MPSKSAIIGELAKFSLVYQRRSSEALQALVELWVEDLAELNDDALIRACALARKRCKFWPTPAELLEFHEHAQPKYETTHVPLPESPEKIEAMAKRNAARARDIRRALHGGERPDWIAALDRERGRMQ
ncbi:hypothetical protein [Desulfovibrio inopinatus]|uniref:hypothetical protein n=1 Tax=Desulfovibrio inopinatus TaxID=102109 RepID=UPI0012EB36D6|nr:hypothetical protein [Desulfovibrio inopinatus]